MVIFERNIFSKRAIGVSSFDSLFVFGLGEVLGIFSTLLGFILIFGIFSEELVELESKSFPLNSIDVESDADSSWFKSSLDN